MNDEYTFIITDMPDVKDANVVRNGLEGFHASQGIPADWIQLAIFIHHEQDGLVGGLTGGTYWGWLYVARLWIQESLRGQGFGSRLLQDAEQEAVRRGCHHVYLDTHELQALPFYLKHGYTVFGELSDCPVGFRRYFLQKQLETG
jgi:GNAT superfamily N-acetyltransferase